MSNMDIKPTDDCGTRLGVSPEPLQWHDCTGLRFGSYSRVRIARALLRVLSLLGLWVLGVATSLFFTGAAVGELLMHAFPLLPPYSSQDDSNPIAIASVDAVTALFGVGVIWVGYRLATLSLYEFDSFLVGDRFVSSRDRLYACSLWFGLIVGCLVLVTLSTYVP